MSGTAASRTAPALDRLTAPARARWIALLLVLAPPPAVLHARPVPTIHPGGAPAAPDTIVIEYRAHRAPSLLSLRAAGPLAPGVASSGPADTSTWLRRTGVAAIAGPAPIPGTTGSVPPGGSLAALGNAAPPPTSGSGDAITFSGLKTLSVEVGTNRSAALEQSLDLTVRGRVGGDVEVAATLSDRQLPFEPDGSSRELEDLDRISLSVRAPRAEATMGDFRFEALPGEFARLTRQLQGVRGSARTGEARWNVAAASAKGERRALEFRGEEGRQGPYPLLARNLGEEGNGIVGSSETVWLDGIRLKRGAEDDYVMDYGTGTITFTVRRPITAQSRIAVDFEAGSSRYRRSLYAATTQGGSPGRTWFASYVTEGDDADSPLGADLTPADREALSELGDSTASVLPSGVRHVGPGGGSYAWDESDPAAPRWVYLGPARGDYEVEFASVGPGRGAYADTIGADGLRFFRYKGASLGAYVPGRAVGAPSSRALVNLGGGARLFEAVGLEAEVARSDVDRNALSARDDGDNGGMAGRLAARLEPRSVRVGGISLGTVRAQGLVRSIGDRFQAFDRVDAAFEDERWNQASTQGGGEDRQEVSVQIDPTVGLALRGEMGHRRLSGGSSSNRQAAQADLRSWMQGIVRWEEARNASGPETGLRSVWALDLGRETGWLLPRVSARREWIRGQEGDSVESRASREARLGLGLAPVPSVRIRGGYGIREGEIVDSGVDPSIAERATTWDGGVSARAGASFSIDGGFTRRAARSGAATQATHLSQLAVLAGRPGGPVTSELRYDVTQLREATPVRELRAVGEGSGSYDAFGNPRLGGGYELVTSAGEPLTRSRAVVQLRLDAYPARAALRPGRKAPPWRGFGGSTFLRVEALSELPLGELAHALKPRDYFDPAMTLRGDLTARQTLEFAPAGRRYDARAEIGFRRERSSEIESLASEREALDARLTVRHPLPARLRATWSASVDRADRTAERIDTVAAYTSSLRGRGFELEVARELRGLGQVSIVTRRRIDEDRTNGGSYGLWSFGPAARCAAGSRMRLDARALVGVSAQRGAYAPSGLYVAAPVGRRLDYDLLGEYRVRERISVSVSWAGASAPGRPTTYTGRFELKGSF